jgi:hypothetical protein
VLKIDAGRVDIPRNQIYSQIEKARAQIAGLIAPRPRVSGKGA